MASGTVNDYHPINIVRGTYTSNNGKSSFVFPSIERRGWIIIGANRLFVGFWTASDNFDCKNIIDGSQITNFTVTGSYTLEFNSLSWYDNPWAITFN